MEIDTSMKIIFFIIYGVCALLINFLQYYFEAHFLKKCCHGHCDNSNCKSYHRCPNSKKED